jgi:hypothetical protein
LDSVFGLAPESISGVIHWASEKAGVNLHTHSLRHFFATRLVDNGTDIEVVRRLLGHSSLNNTKKYLARTDKQRREAIMSLDHGTVPETKSAPTVTKDHGPNVKSPGIVRHPETATSETAHKTTVRRLAVTLAERIILPSFTNRDLWRELPLPGPGTYHLEIGTATLRADRSVSVIYGVPAVASTTHLERSLKAHMTSCGTERFSGLLEEPGMLYTWAEHVALTRRRHYCRLTAL